MTEAPEKGEKFTCSMCGETFLAEWTAEEANEERKANNLENVKCDIVCEDCYKKSPWGGGPNWQEILEDKSLPLHQRLYAYIKLLPEEENEEKDVS